MGNRLQKGHGNIVEGRVGNYGEITANGGKVWCVNALHIVAVETKGGVNGSEGWDVDGGDVSESHVVSEDQVWKIEIQVGSIGVHVERSSHVSKLGAEVLQVLVVVDVEHVNRLQVDTVQVVELGIRDDERVSARDTQIEGEELKSVQSLPEDSVNTGQHGEYERGHDGQALQVEGTSNGSQGGSFEGSQVDSSLANKTALNLIDTIQSDVTSGARGNENRSLDGRT